MSSSTYDVALVNPLDETVLMDYFSPCENLAIAYLGGYTRHLGFETVLIDGDSERIPKNQVIARVLASGAKVVGITCLSRTVYEALDIARQIKRYRPETHVCLGGQHITYAADEVIQTYDFVDSVVRGEGEIPFGRIVDGVFRGEPLANVAGAYVRDASGRVHFNPDQKGVENFDDLPFPARDTLERLSKGGHSPVIAMQSSRGCFGRCTFCNATDFGRIGNTKVWRGRSAKSVVDELEMLTKRFGDGSADRTVHFYDDEFVGPGNVGRQRARAIAEEILRRDLRLNFYIFCRADSFIPGHEELLGLLKRAGLTRAFIGIESSVSSELQLFKKGTTPEQNMETLKLLEQHNIAMPASGFIMFHPFSTFEVLRQNGRYLQFIGHHSFYNLSVKLIAYKGNGIIEQLRARNLLGRSLAAGGMFEYAFADSRLDAVANAMEAVSSHALLKKADAVVRYTQDVMYYVKDHVAGVDFSPVAAQVKVIFDRGLDLFMEALDLAEHGWSESQFESSTHRFLADLTGLLDELDTTFGKAIESAGSLIDVEQAAAAGASIPC